MKVTITKKNTPPYAEKLMHTLTRKELTPSRLPLCVTGYYQLINRGTNAPP